MPTPTTDGIWQTVQGLLGQFGSLYRSLTVYGQTLPWNQPWGIVGFAQPTASGQTGITTVVDLTGLTVTWTAVANRRYKATWAVTVLQNTSTGTNNVGLTDGSNTQLSTPGTTLTAAAFGVVAGVYVSTFSAGSQTLKLRALTTAGTLSINQSSTAPNTLVVEDIGPSAAKS